MPDISDYSDVLRSLTAACESKIKNLSDIKNITLELKYAIEEEEEGVTDESGTFDVFDEILTRREIKIDEQKIIMTTMNHYKSQLPSDMLDIINSAESGDAEDHPASGEGNFFEIVKAINKLAVAEKKISADIRTAENFNLIHMKILINDVKKKLDNIRKNRIIMDKFVTGEADIKTGSLLNKKK